MILNLNTRELDIIINTLIDRKKALKKELDAWRPNPEQEPIEQVQERAKMIEDYNEVDNLKCRLILLQMGGTI